MCSLNFLFLSSLIEELCTKEENNKAGCTLIFGGQCIFLYYRDSHLCHYVILMSFDVLLKKLCC